jgi:hypothetical protein
VTRVRIGRVALLSAILFGASASAGTPPAVAAVAGPSPGSRAGESSIGILFGVGWYENSDFNADLVGVGIDPIENGFEYGVQYRHRVSRWFSIGGELARMDGRTNPPDGSNSEFGISTTSFLLDVFVHPVTVRDVSLTLFGGAGPLISTRLSQTFPSGAVLDGKRTGFGVMGGAEGELRRGPNFGFFVRGLARQARSKDVVIDDGSGLNPVVYDVDFDGIGVTFGPRWYFGGGPR